MKIQVAEAERKVGKGINRLSEKDGNNHVTIKHGNADLLWAIS